MDLTAARRKKMPKKEFAGGEGAKSFPINDPNHARMAISGATRAEHAGNISSSTANRIKSEARAKLAGHGHKRSTPKGYTGSY